MEKKFIAINENAVNDVGDEQYILFGGFGKGIHKFASQEEAEGWAAKKSAKNIDSAYIVFQAVSRVEAKLPDANITKL